MRACTMSPRVKQFFGLALVVLLLSTALPAYAQWEPERKDFPGKRQLTKLGRGLANLLTGWAEIPKEIWTQATKPADTFNYLAIASPVIGAGKAVGRTAVGLFELFTFFLPIPEDYAPIIDPEYVF